MEKNTGADENLLDGAVEYIWWWKWVFLFFIFIFLSIAPKASFKQFGTVASEFIKTKKKLSYHSGLCCMEVAHRLLVSDYKQILSSNWNCCLPHTLHNPCQTLYRPLCFFFHYHQQHQHQRRIIIIDCHSHSCISAETKFMDGISLNYWPANNNARGGDSAPASPH